MQEDPTVSKRTIFKRTLSKLLEPINLPGLFALEDTDDDDDATVEGVVGVAAAFLRNCFRGVVGARRKLADMCFSGAVKLRRKICCGCCCCCFVVVVGSSGSFFSSASISSIETVLEDRKDLVLVLDCWVLDRADCND